MEQGIGKKIWAVPEGYIPKWSQGSKPEFESHGTVCILNTNTFDAEISIYIYYSDKDPVGPYKFTVPAQRTRHIRFNEIDDPEPIPKGTDFSSVIESSVPVVVQHTRLDSRQAENALMSTIAYGAD